MRNTMMGVAAAAVAGLLLGGTAGLAQTADRFVSFDEFVRGLTSARSAQYVGQAQNRVRGVANFEEMRQHLLRMYRGVHVRHSFVLDAQYFDCVPLAEQPSVRLQGLSIAPPPPAPPSVPRDSGNGSSQDSPLPALQAAPNEKFDRFGNAAECENGTIPMLRMTLEDLSRFSSLREFFQKGPDGAGQVPFGRKGSRAGETHKYAHAFQSVSNLGGGSNLNLWIPRVNTNNGEVFSLSQHWYVNFRNDGKVQTIEGGWQKFPQFYHIKKPVLFIYWTADGYGATGCYNLTCAAFVQVNNSVRIGGAFQNYSKLNGDQYDFQLRWFLTGGKWWLYIGDTAVGYYPTSLYQGGPLAASASSIDYGGETVGSTSWPKMGSGRFPRKRNSFGIAAFHRLIHYFNSPSTLAAATLTRSEPSPTCYKIKVFNNTSDANWKSYFYYGGPGGTGCE